MRFFALQRRCGEARHADVLPLAVSHAGHAAWTRRLNVHRKFGHVNGRSRRDRSVHPNDRARKRPVTSSATASQTSPPATGHASSLLLARCSATGSSLRGLARRVVLPSARRAALLGFQIALRRLAPATDDRPSLTGWPTCLFVQWRAPIDFRRVRSTASGKMRAVNLGGKSRVQLDWLLGFDSRLRSVSQSALRARSRPRH
jgi:hypothetical protein